MLFKMENLSRKVIGGKGGNMNWQKIILWSVAMVFGIPAVCFLLCLIATGIFWFGTIILVKLIG
jgi:hypothetical protein